MYNITPPLQRWYMYQLSAALTAAVDTYGWLPAHPMRAFQHAPASPMRVRFLTDDERQRLLAACERSPNRTLGLIVLLALCTGAQKQEVLSLRWENVDLGQGVLCFASARRATPRAVPVAGAALTALRTYHRWHPTQRGYVWPAGPTGRPREFDWAWKTACADAGLKDFRFQDLRHTTASYLALHGASLTDIAAVLGHTSPRMAQRYLPLTVSDPSTLLVHMTTQVFGDAALGGSPHTKGVTP